MAAATKPPRRLLQHGLGFGYGYEIVIYYKSLEAGFHKVRDGNFHFIETARDPILSYDYGMVSLEGADRINISNTSQGYLE